MIIKDGKCDHNQTEVATHLSSNTAQAVGGAHYISTARNQEASMSNGRPDAWSTIPLAVLAGAEDSTTVEAYNVGGRNATLTERDYIGLSDSSMVVQASFHHERSSDAEAHDLECKDTELRLGIGPCNGGVSSADVAHDGSSEGSRVVGETYVDNKEILSSSKAGMKSALAELPNNRNEHFFAHLGARVSSLGWSDEQQLVNAEKYMYHKSFSSAQIDGVAPNLSQQQQQQHHHPHQQNELPKQEVITPLHHVKPDLNVAPIAGDHLHRGASPSSAIPQNLWQVARDFRVNGSGDQSGGEAGCYKSYPWGPGLAPGRFVIPVPKVSTVPAKRPYLEAIGDNKATSSCNATQATTKSSGNIGGSASLITSADAAHLNSNPSSTSGTPAAGGGGLYTWSTNAMQKEIGWQHVNFEQGSNVGALGKSTSLLRVLQPPPPPPHFKVPTAPVSHNLPPIASPSTSSKGEAFLKSDSQNEESRNKSPVVGWPPVRSFRKNTLQATHGHKVNTEGQQENAHEAGGSGGGEVSEQSNHAFYVKAKLDGIRICRKVDLNSYDSYDSLKSALQEMFQGFVNGHSDSTKLDLLHGKNYVLTHEDKDGDWMLVGDVPWHMFVASTVKSFRIMKAADAIGLGERVSAKLKAQDNCKS